jgi:hypothetical protein
VRWSAVSSSTTGADTGVRPGALGEDVDQPDVAVGSLARAAFAAGDVVAGATPAHEARCAVVGKRAISRLISAMMVSAARLPTRVMVSSRSRAGRTGPRPRWGERRTQRRSARRAERSRLRGGRFGPGTTRSVTGPWSARPIPRSSSMGCRGVARHDASARCHNAPPDGPCGGAPSV